MNESEKGDSEVVTGVEGVSTECCICGTDGWVTCKQNKKHEAKNTCDDCKN